MKASTRHHLPGMWGWGHGRGANKMDGIQCRTVDGNVEEETFCFRGDASGWSGFLAAFDFRNLFCREIIPYGDSKILENPIG